MENGLQTKANIENESMEAAPAEQNPKVKSAKDSFFERIRIKRPEAQYDESEDEYYNQANSFMDELEKRSMRYDEFRDSLIKRFDENPDEAQVILDYIDGKPLREAVYEYLGDAPEEGSEGYDTYQEAGKRRAEMYKKQNELAQEIRANRENSKTALREFAEENNLTDEQVTSLAKAIYSDLDDITMGRFTKDTYARYLKALNHDSDVEGARRQGEIDGKNAAIEAKHAKMKGSGLPNGASGGNVNDEITGSDDPRQQLANRMAGFRRG